MELTRARLADLLHYDPESGEFSWKGTPRGGKHGVCGSVSKVSGYAQIGIGGRIYFAHRLAYLYMTGEMPPRGVRVDHINRNRSDNRWGNLRIAVAHQNNANAGLQRTNTSGLRGVSWDKVNGRWTAQITINGRNKKIGRYATKEDAAAAYAAVAAEHFGEFVPDYVRAYDTEPRHPKGLSPAS